MGDGEALVNVRIMSGVRAESCLREGIFKVRRLCSLAHLYFMLPLRQMKREPPGTRGDPLTLQREVLRVGVFFVFFVAGPIPTPTHIHNRPPAPTHAGKLLRPH